MKKLPIGINSFEEMIDENYYYVDKSLLIKEIVDIGAKVTLIPRPRRFGKTLNMSMLHCFFEKSERSRANLFSTLAIAQDDNAMAHQGQYPIIFLTFKFTDNLTWPACCDKLKLIIAEEFRRHRYLLDTPLLDGTQKKNFEKIISLEASNILYEVSLKHLTTYLAEYYKTPPIVLIDEYDVPIHAGYRYGYYDDVVAFIKSFLGDGLKDNNHLKFAVVTGALRVAKESIFTGLNNLDVCTFLDESYSDKFGLLAHEVDALLAHYHLETHLGEIKSWYNGYHSGSHMIYNPWSIVNLAKKKGDLLPYWINTSNNDIVKTLIKESDQSVKSDIEKLILGESITKKICEDIVYAEIKKSNNVLWNFLLFSGYLTFKNRRLIEETVYADFIIPNREVVSFYKSTILAWFDGAFVQQEYSQMLKSLIDGDIETFRSFFSAFVLTSFSYFDVSGKKPENFYHAFVLGMLVNLTNRYEIKSNRESGFGRYDVMLIPHDPSKLGIIIEFKTVDECKEETLEMAAESALRQIEEKMYAQEMHARGIATVQAIAIAFSGKKVMILDSKHC
jgi:hypothetical protein